MPGLSERVVNESLEHYRELIDNYNQIIAKNKKQMEKPGISQSKRDAFKMLIENAEKEKRKCQKDIERLLSE